MLKLINGVITIFPLLDSIIMTSKTLIYFLIRCCNDDTYHSGTNKSKTKSSCYNGCNGTKELVATGRGL